MRSLLASCAVLATLVFAPLAQAEFGLLAAWGEQGRGDGQFESPGGVAADGTGAVYVADTYNDRIQVFDACHRFVAAWGASGSGDGQLNSPLGVALGSGGDVYVADTGNNRVEVFDAAGSFVRAWGGFGSGPGRFRLPFAIAVDPHGDVYVADTDNNRVQKFDSSGAFLAQWGRFGSGNGQFDTPFGLTVGPNGDVYVADTFNNRVQEFSPSGDFVRGGAGSARPTGSSGPPAGSPPAPTATSTSPTRTTAASSASTPPAASSTSWGEFGPGDGQFRFAAGVGADPFGNVYVTETYPNDRIQMFGDPPPTIAELREAVAALSLPRGIANSLEAKLKNVREDGPAASVAGKLAAFVAELNAQSGKHVPAASAGQLIAEAERVIRPRGLFLAVVAPSSFS